MLLPAADNFLVFLDLHACLIHSLGESMICFNICRTYGNEDDCLKLEDIARGEAISARASCSLSFNCGRCKGDLA